MRTRAKPSARTPSGSINRRSDVSALKLQDVEPDVAVDHVDETRFVERNVGYPLAFDGTRSRTELGLSYRPLDDTIAEHFQQMLDDGVVKRIPFV